MADVDDGVRFSGKIMRDAGSRVSVVPSVAEVPRSTEYNWQAIVRHVRHSRAKAKVNTVLQATPITNMRTRVLAERQEYESPRTVKLCSKFTDSFDSPIEHEVMIVGPSGHHTVQLQAKPAFHHEPFAVTLQEEEIEETMQEVRPTLGASAGRRCYAVPLLCADW